MTTNNMTTEQFKTKKIKPLRYCTGGCSKGEHSAHFYSVDPVDGKLDQEYLCPGNKKEVLEILDEEGESTLDGFIR